VPDGAVTLQQRRPFDPVTAHAAEKGAREAWQARASEAEALVLKARAERDAAIERAARAEAGADAAHRDAERQHRIGYLEARSKYGLGGMALGLVLTAIVATGSAQFNAWRQAMAVRETVKASNEAFGQGVAVGAVRADAEDKGLNRGREPADAPR